MSSNTGRLGSPLGMFGGWLVVCCGLPLLLAVGIAVGASGLTLGSGVVATTGIALAVWGGRHRRGAVHCELSEPEPQQVTAALCTLSGEPTPPHAAHSPRGLGGKAVSTKLWVPNVSSALVDL